MRVHSSPNVKESESYVYNAVITVISSVSFAEVKKQLVKKENVHIMWRYSKGMYRGVAIFRT